MYCVVKSGRYEVRYVYGKERRKGLVKEVRKRGGIESDANRDKGGIKSEIKRGIERERERL